jgi:PPOX class probable F420-dependent enzyme
MARMTNEELEAFLRRPLIAVLSTKRAGGSLHSTPVWFEYEDGLFYFWVDTASVKGRNILSDPEVSVCIATSNEPYEYVTASGRCEISSNDVKARCFSITRRYYDEPRARAFVDEDLGAQTSMLLVLRPRLLVSENSG